MSSPHPLPPADYETRDASPRFIGLMGLILVLLVGASLAASAGIYHWRYARSGKASGDLGKKSFRFGAEWQSSIARDWAEEDRLTRQHLTTYGWVDRKAGVTRVPIERAMALVAGEAKP